MTFITLCHPVFLDIREYLHVFGTGINLQIVFHQTDVTLQVVPSASVIQTNESGYTLAERAPNVLSSTESYSAFV